MANVQHKLVTAPRVGSALKAKMEALERTLLDGVIATPEASAEPTFPKPSAFRCKPPDAPKPKTSTSPLQAPKFIGIADDPFPLIERTDPSFPKKKNLPDMFSLGNPPQKPNRPPNVDVRRFQYNGLSLNEDPCNTTGRLQTKAHNGIHSFAMNPPVEQEWSSDDANYEDVDEVVQPTPSLPFKVAGQFPVNTPKHLSQQIEAEDNDDLYDCVDDNWPEQKTIETNISKEIKKKDKKQLQQEKKLQEANKKREQAAKKNFKIKGPVQVLHEGKARLDYRPTGKKGKTHLALKKGEAIEIIRMTDNPEGHWLARNSECCYGYVQINCVDIDNDRLKGYKLSTNSSEVYDDVGAQSDFPSDAQGQNSEDDGGDDYVDVIEECLIPLSPPPPPSIGFEGFPDPLLLPPPPPPPLVGCEGDLYDDVGDFLPPPPPLDWLPQTTTKENMGTMMDPQKKKTFEKEEKAFKKKFKFEGEIQVLYSVKIATTLANKKWGNKDLPLNPGEEIDVIQEAVNGKLIGRNKKGKFGHVALVNVVQQDDVYDDIGEGCIYDN